MLISKKYDLIYRFKTHPHIKVDAHGNVVNSLTSRLKKITLNGRSKGLWLDSKTFVVKSKLNDLLEKIPKTIYPF